MGFRNFRINIILRILFLLVSLAALAWFIMNNESIRAVYTGILVVLLIFEYFYYTDRLNRDLNQFFVSILHDDFTSVFSERTRSRTFSDLYRTLDEITLKYRAMSREKEMRGQYLYSLIEQVRVGIISYEPDGRVHLVNSALPELLGLPGLRTGSYLPDTDEDLYSFLLSMNPGEKQLLKRRINKEEKVYSVLTSKFRMDEQDFLISSVQDIREELDMKETEAWQKLIRVLTHEIMNSVSPIASLSESLGRLVPENQDPKMVRLGQGLRAVQERSESLMKFTEAYQELSRVPNPSIKAIKTDAFCARVEALFRSNLESSGINLFIITTDAPSVFQADPDLVEQVIINLFRNAMDALKSPDELDTPDAPDRSGKGEIRLSIESRPEGRVALYVRDNGSGIPEDLLDRIFVPFFSTRENGSGIGLSLSRQIALMHRGSLNVTSKEGEGSSFELLL